MSKMTALMLLLLIAPDARCDDVSTNLRQQLDHRNQAISEALVREDIATLATYYADGAMLMPEHSKARSGRRAIEDYYRQWFAQLQVATSRKTSYEVLEYGDYAVETGTFVQTFSRTGQAPYRYQGKYMTLWSTQGKQPVIVSELWGANAPFDDALLAQIDDSALPNEDTFQNDRNLLAEIRGRNEIIGRLVTERNGNEHADMFLPDAIYMTYYTPMLVGIENIRPYFIEHEKPGDVSIDALALRSGTIYSLAGGKLHLEQGFYNVTWRAGDKGGTVTGKSLNLWKRDEHGKLMLFRQAVNHD